MVITPRRYLNIYYLSFIWVKNSGIEGRQLMQGSEEVLVPLIVFTSITLIIGWILLYQFSKKRAFLRLLEKQPGLQPESIKAIGQRLFASNNDLRKGIFCVVIACAIWGFSLLTHFHS